MGRGTARPHRRGRVDGVDTRSWRGRRTVPCLSSGHGGRAARGVRRLRRRGSRPGLGWSRRRHALGSLGGRPRGTPGHGVLVPRGRFRASRPDTPEELRDRVRSCLRDAVPARRSKITGTMRRTLPTTLAALRFRVTSGELACRALWAGDSRAYLLTPRSGLQVLTRDHTEETDTLEQLRGASPPMTNVLCAGPDSSSSPTSLTRSACPACWSPRRTASSATSVPRRTSSATCSVRVQHAERRVGLGSAAGRRGQYDRVHRRRRLTELSSPWGSPTSATVGCPSPPAPGQVIGGDYLSPPAPPEQDHAASREMAGTDVAVLPRRGYERQLPRSPRSSDEAGRPHRRLPTGRRADNGGGGKCVWAFAEKDGREYFIKRFLEPKRPREGRRAARPRGCGWRSAGSSRTGTGR